MTGPNQALLLLVVLAVDLSLNWLWIEQKGKEPNHILLWIARAVVGASIVWNPEITTWLARCLNLAIIYWFVFDYGLNKLIGKDWTYLGIEDKRSMIEIVKDDFMRGRISLLDQLQLKSLGAYPGLSLRELLLCFVPLTCCTTITHTGLSYKLSTFSKPNSYFNE